MTNNVLQHPGPSGKALPFTTFDDCNAFTSKPWILKGLIARGDISSWIAPPMGGKTTLLDWLFIHCAQGVDRRGRRAKRACGVVIFALERSDQHKAHMRAYQMRDGLKNLPIAVVDTMVDLCSPSCIGTIVATVRAVEATLGVAVGIVAFDTFNKGIAINGDEDKAKDQNKCAANLRQVQREIEVHGRRGSRGDGLPNGVKTVSKDVWREKCIERGISSGDRKSANTAFNSIQGAQRRALHRRGGSMGVDCGLGPQ